MMTQAERLTYYLMKGSENDGYYLKPGVTREQAIERLAHYEDLSEQKRLIELPCPIGTSLWRVCVQPTRRNQKGKVFTKSTQLSELNFFRIVFNNEFGNLVFLTKAEADKRALEIREKMGL